MRVMRIYVECRQFHKGGSNDNDPTLDNDPIIVCTRMYMYVRRMRVMRIYIKCGEFHIGGSTDNDPVFVCTQTYMYVRVKTECNALHSFFTRV